MYDKQENSTENREKRMNALRVHVWQGKNSMKIKSRVVAINLGGRKKALEEDCHFNTTQSRVMTLTPDLIYSATKSSFLKTTIKKQQQQQTNCLYKRWVISLYLFLFMVLFCVCSSLSLSISLLYSFLVFRSFRAPSWQTNSSVLYFYIHFPFDIYFIFIKPTNNKTHTTIPIL